jgi:hypothetical protein
MADHEVNEFRSGVKLSIVVTHHPSRAARVARLLEGLGERWHIHLVVDDRDEPPGLAGLEYTFLRAAAEVAPGATHHLILQDDIVPCRDVIYALGTKIIPAVPNAPIGLYHNCRGTVPGVPWILGDCWGQTKLMPTHLWERFLQFNAQAFVPGLGRFSSDARVGLFYRTLDLDVWCTVPSLFEHGTVSGESLLGHNGKVTKSRDFVGVEASALAVNWRAGWETAADVPKARGSFTGLLRSQAGWLAPAFWKQRGIDVADVHPLR